MALENWDFSILPGLTAFGPGFGLPIAVMSALVEEPFYHHAGVRSHSIRWSLRANTVAYFWSCGCLPFICFLADGHSDMRVLFLIFSIFAIPVLIHSKYFYLLKHTRMSDSGLKWVVLGNEVSSLIAFPIFFSLP